MRIGDIVYKPYVPEPLVKAAQQAHKVEVRSEMQEPNFWDCLLKNMANLKDQEANLRE